MAVNVTNITNIGSIYEYANIVDSATNGLFFGIILIALFIILILNMRNQGVPRAIAGASFSCLIIATIFWNIGLVQIAYPVIFALCLAGSLVYLNLKPTG